MKTRIVPTTVDQSRAVEMALTLLHAKEVVALPTETVYGLAADALEPEAIVKIFEAKNRPFFDPLIVHVAERDWLDELVHFDSETQSILEELLNRFWPGPLTILFPKREIIPDLVTAGLDEVAVRQPQHPVFLEVLRRYDKPLAAPSANRFGRISPTTAWHVLAELEGRIPLILDGGPTLVGLESTVVRVREMKIEILRPGPITEDQLRKVTSISEATDSSGKSASPGQTASHYAPGKKVELYYGANQEVENNSGLICWGPPPEGAAFRIIRSLSITKNLAEAARRLFGLLREMDEEEISRIYIEPVPEEGIGIAIMNRIRKSAGPRE